MALLGAIRAALAFLTRIPVGSSPLSKRDEMWGPALFPVVGAFIGLCGASVLVTCGRLGGGAASWLAIATTMFLTGALHEDGLADTFDALGKAGSTEARLLVMKDSRIGSFGSAALIVSVATRAALVERLAPSAMVLWPLAAAWARTAPVWQLVHMPYVTAPGTSKSAAVLGTGWTQAVLASLASMTMTAVALLLNRLSWHTVAWAFAALSITVGLTSAQWQKLFGGVTGDLLGATEQLCEITLLAAFAWSSG